MSSIIKVNTYQDANGNALFSSDGSGTVTLDSNFSGVLPSNTPSFRAGRSSSQSISNATYTVIVFDSEQYDTNSAYDTSNGRFTVPSGEAGKYFFYATYRWQYATASDIPFNMEIHKNGSQVAHFNARGQQYPSVSLAYSGDLSVSDYIEVKAYQNSGGSLDLTGNIAYTSFFGMKVA